MAESYYKSVYTGETIDETIKTLRLDKNWEAFQNLYSYSGRLESLENNINAICDGLNINEEFRILKKLQESIEDFELKFLKISGGTMLPTAQIKTERSGIGSADSAESKALLSFEGGAGNGISSYVPLYNYKLGNGSFSFGANPNKELGSLVWYYKPNNKKSEELAYLTYDGCLMGACWNDYAEFRKTNEEIKPGTVVCENGDGTLSISQMRLYKGAEIVSDTYGFAIGKGEGGNTPLAVTGRVLAYPLEDPSSYSPGDAVCAGPNGTVSKMTREEIKSYPERIIGTVSEIPTYTVWGKHNVQVNGRIWIRIK